MFKAIDVYVVTLNGVVIAIYPTRTSAVAFCDGILFENPISRLVITYNDAVIFANNIN
jgi:hypothetical protein